jgi:hypothetical protein
MAQNVPDMFRQAARYVDKILKTLARGSGCNLVSSNGASSSRFSVA